MATTYPLATLAAQITDTGISAPAYSDIYASLQASVKAIYGTDVYIDPDSQDGQLLAIVAKAQYDANATAIATYNSLSPATSQGVALSNNVKLNGIARLVASNSTATVTLTGTVGTVISNGIVQDISGNNWNLPASVTIPLAGSINVTATAASAGAITAGVGEINKIQTPTLGWQSVTNAASASVGAPVETDAALRQRQTLAVALPSLTVLDGLLGAVKSLLTVSEAVGYNNDTNATDANGLPAHSISLVVNGGADADIARTIFDKKGPGVATYGTTNVTVVDSGGNSNAIHFFRPTQATILVAVTVHPLTSGWTTTIGDSLKQAIVDYINALPIGGDVYRTELYLPAKLFGAPDSATYNVTSLLIAKSPDSPGSSDVTIAFNEVAVCTLANVSLAVA